MTLRFVVIFGTALLAVSLARPAASSEAYPEEIQEQLELPRAPACTLCHRSDDGGVNTVNKPFGTSMLRLGATGGANVRGVDAALARSEADGIDSDEDGVGDIDELRAGENPNVGLSGEVPLADTPLPETGCRVARAGAGAGPGFGAVLVLLGGLLLRRRIHGSGV